MTGSANAIDLCPGSLAGRAQDVYLDTMAYDRIAHILFPALQRALDDRLPEVAHGAAVDADDVVMMRHA